MRKVKSEPGGGGREGVEGRSDGTLRGSGRAGAVQEEHNDSYWEDAARRTRERRGDSGMGAAGDGGGARGGGRRQKTGRKKTVGNAAATGASAEKKISDGLHSRRTPAFSVCPSPPTRSHFSSCHHYSHCSHPSPPPSLPTLLSSLPSSLIFTFPSLSSISCTQPTPFPGCGVNVGPVP